MDAVAFQQKWIGASNLKEKTASQSHFNDLCDLLGVPKPLDADHTGEAYTFEKGAGIIGGAAGSRLACRYRGPWPAVSGRSSGCLDRRCCPSRSRLMLRESFRHNPSFQISGP